MTLYFPFVNTRVFHISVLQSIVFGLLLLIQLADGWFRCHNFSYWVYFYFFCSWFPASASRLVLLSHFVTMAAVRAIRTQKKEPSKRLQEQHHHRHHADHHHHRGGKKTAATTRRMRRRGGVRWSIRMENGWGLLALAPPYELLMVLWRYVADNGLAILGTTTRLLASFSISRTRL